MKECTVSRKTLAKGFRNYQKVFIALGDETRLQIILALLDSPNIGMRVPEITEQTHLSRPAVSHHLKVLKDVGLIGMHRQGTRNYYYMDANVTCWHGLRGLIDEVDDLVKHAAQEGYPHVEEE